jgi:hypothetical protein
MRDLLGKAAVIIVMVLCALVVVVDLAWWQAGCGGWRWSVVVVRI